MFSLWGTRLAFNGNTRDALIKSRVAMVASFTPQRLIHSVTVTLSVSLNRLSDPSPVTLLGDGQ